MPPETACVSIGRSPTAGEYQKLLGTTRHGKRDGTWPSRAAQGVKKHLRRVMTMRWSPMSFSALVGSGWARGWLRVRLRDACQLEGSETTHIWPQRLIKTEARQAFPPTIWAADSPSPEPLWSVFLPNQRKLQNYTYLHSPNGLGGLKSLPKQVRGDSKFHSPSSWETLASTEIIQEGNKTSLRAKRRSKNREEMTTRLGREVSGEKDEREKGIQQNQQ